MMRDGIFGKEEGLNYFQVVSYFTKGTKYEKEIRNLRESLIQLGIPYRIEGIPNRRSWVKNTHEKPRFLLRMLDELEEYDSVVWTDADSIFRKYPELFNEIREDVGIHFRNWRHGKNEVLSGTLFLRNCEKVRLLLKEWILINRRNPSKWDQKNLDRALRRFPDLSIHRLPIEYCTVFDDERRRKLDPVVEHFQASRKLRWKVDHGSSR